jgi:aerobic carbon-monoxide dehydrogenase medium subunit
VKPSRFVLHTPRTVREAQDLLAALPNARVLAGGQSLMPMLNMRLAAPDHLVDLNRIDEMSHIREEHAAIVLGAMTRQRDIEFSELVAARLPLMRDAILNVGHRQTRNRGTIGGSLCHLDPSAELPTVAMAMDATMEIGSTSATRSLEIAKFIQGFMTTALHESEILLQIRVKPWVPGHGWCFVEFARRHGDFAIVSAATLLELDSNRRITRIALTLGGVGPAPLRLSEAEQALIGGADNESTLKLAADHANACDALDDPAYPSWYRRRLARNLLCRAISGAFARARPY